MSRRRSFVPVIALCLGGALAWSAPAHADEASDRIRIGIVSSLVQDAPSVVVGALLEPFAALVRAPTGLTAEVVRGRDYESLGRQVCRGELDLGVFQGIEFAWLCQAQPELRPLVIALNQKDRARAYLVVRAGSPAACFADLKGKSLRLPRQSRLHSRLFLERGCERAGRLPPEQFFSKFETPPNAEDALDDVVDGSLDAVVVNEVAFESYQRRKPHRCARLKVAQKSEVFPPSVIAYRPGALPAEKLKQFRDGLLNSNKGVLSRHLMSFWRLTRFEAVPPDFHQIAAAIVKDYPTPVPQTAGVRSGRGKAANE